MAAEGRRVIAAGRAFWVVDCGARDGPCLLLLHGVGASGHSFHRLVAQLGQRYRLILPDLPGHGFSEGLRPGRSGLVPMAEDLGRLCAEIGVRPDAVIGHSAGAAVGLQMALSGGIRAVVGINAALRPFGGPAGLLFPALARGLSLMPMAATAFSRLWGQRSQVERLLDATGSRIEPEMVARYLVLVKKPGHVAAALQMMAEWDLAPLLSRLPKLDLPVLLVTGAKDRTVPPDVSARAALRLPQGKHLSLPGLGHLAQEEAADGLASVILPFLETALAR